MNEFLQKNKTNARNFKGLIQGEKIFCDTEFFNREAFLKYE